MLVYNHPNAIAFNELNINRLYTTLRRGILMKRADETQRSIRNDYLNSRLYPNIGITPACIRTQFSYVMPATGAAKSRTNRINSL